MGGMSIFCDLGGCPECFLGREKLFTKIPEQGFIISFMAV